MENEEKIEVDGGGIEVRRKLRRMVVGLRRHLRWSVAEEKTEVDESAWWRKNLRWSVVGLMWKLWWGGVRWRALTNGPGILSFKNSKSDKMRTGWGIGNTTSFLT